MVSENIEKLLGEKYSFKTQIQYLNSILYYHVYNLNEIIFLYFRIKN